MTRTSCAAPYIAVIVTMAPHRFDHHLEMAEMSCGHWVMRVSAIDSVAGWIAARFAARAAAPSFRPAPE